MTDSGPISSRAIRERNAPIVLFSLIIVVGLVGTLTLTRQVLLRAMDGVWPSTEELPALVPLAFALIGLFGLIHTVRKRRSEARGDEMTAERSSPSVTRSGALRPQWSPWGKVVGGLVIAAFWNGIVSVLVYGAFIHPGDLFSRVMGIFLIPFVLIGIGLVGFVLYQLLAVFNPRTTLRVGSTGVRLGAPVPLEWELEGAVHRLRSLRVLLEGREEATYQQGTSSRTDKNVFCSITVYDSGASGAVDRGHATFAVPRDSMHSWEAKHNKVIWSIKVKGEIPWWPDVDDEFPLNVMPLPEGDAR